jgi:hypothetical protein
MNVEHLGRRCATLAAVIIVAFLCGWSATGLTGGFVTALALGAGCAVPVFTDDRADCSLRFPRGRRSRRSK